MEKTLGRKRLPTCGVQFAVIERIPNGSLRVRSCSSPEGTILNQPQGWSNVNPRTSRNPGKQRFIPAGTPKGWP